MNIMDHEQAVRMHAAERYLLEELSPEERDDFEHHYFTCTHCAAEVRSAFAFADNATAVFSQQQGAKKSVADSPGAAGWRTWLRPAWALAAALLLCVTGYQSMVTIPALQRELAETTGAQTLTTVVARSAARGDDPVVAIGENERFVHLVLDINTVASVSLYACEVRDDSGALRFSVNARAPKNGESLNLLLPASGLQSGRYAVTVRPSELQSTTELSQFTFLVERK